MSLIKRVIMCDPYNIPDNTWMQFRLTYQGKLFSAGEQDKRSRHKHEIRKAFHPQLKTLWESNDLLAVSDPVKQEDNGETKIINIKRSEILANEYNRLGYRFVPLVTDRLCLLCSINIVFLRQDKPGAVISSGDIDNRLKTIFDALRMPANKSELGAYDTPTEGEDPFYCLLEDDKLISSVSVETDTLLQAVNDPSDLNDVRLIITVNVKPYKLTYQNIGYG